MSLALTRKRAGHGDQTRRAVHVHELQVGTQLPEGLGPHAVGISSKRHCFGSGPLVPWHNTQNRSFLGDFELLKKAKSHI